MAGHEGVAYLGDWVGQRVLIFSGRLHHYEGVPWPQVVRSVHISKELGAHTLLLTNSAGGIRDDLTPGSLLVVKSHLEWHRPHFWRAEPGPSPYDRGLIERLQAAGQRLGLALPTGTYAQVSGPCYETPAEIRALRSLGADAVGMSTAREIQSGFDLGLACAAVCCITNRAAGLGLGPIHHEEVLNCTSQSRERFAQSARTFPDPRCRRLACTN